MTVVLVTGASSGIGAASAAAFAAEGFQVVLVARSEDKLKDVAAPLGDLAVVMPCDLSDPDATIALVEQVKAEIGVPDIVLNAAGAGAWKRVEETTPVEAMEMMQAPFFADFYVTSAIMKEMLARDSGILIHGEPPSGGPG